MRLTPFYDIHEMKAKLDGFVTDINANITDLRTFGPASRYEIDDCRGMPVTPTSRGARLASPPPPSPYPYPYRLHR